MKKLFIVLGATPLLLVIFSGSVNAAIISTFLTITNNQNWSQPQQFAEVTVSDGADAGNIGDVDFKVNLCGDVGSPCTGNVLSDAGGQNIEQFGFNIADGFSLALANISGLPLNWIVTPPGGTTMDGFGDFDITVKLGVGAVGVDPLEFSIIGVDGDSALTYASVGSGGGQPNAGGLYAAKISSTGPGAFIGGGEPTEVPEPSIIALFAAGLFGLGFARRRMRS